MQKLMVNIETGEQSLVDLNEAELAELAMAESTYEAAKADSIKILYQSQRANEYPAISDLIIALWESVVEKRDAKIQDLEQLRQSIKAKYPKPQE